MNALDLEECLRGILRNAEIAWVRPNALSVESSGGEYFEEYILAFGVNLTKSENTYENGFDFLSLDTKFVSPDQISVDFVNELNQKN